MMNLETSQVRRVETRSLARLAVAVATVVMFAIPGAAGANANVTARDYIVTYEDGVDSVDRETNQQEDARNFDARLRFRHALKGFAARLTPAQVAALRASPEVASVRADEAVHIMGAVPLAAGGPLPPSGIRRVGAATATTVRERSDVAVAVLDTGVDLTHPDLNVSDGANCVTPGESAEDDHGHGTHVAGIIGARNDGSGAVGVAPGTRVYAVKVMEHGRGSESEVICGIEWVIANAKALNIRVANMSFGMRGANDGQCGSANGSEMHAAICRLVDAGVLPVASAGNEGGDFGGTDPKVPAAFPEVVTVTATGNLDGRASARQGPPCDPRQPGNGAASFSNFATAPEDRAHTVAAPGVCINSTWPGGQYATRSGTSQATPHVAGIAALCFGEAGVPGPCAGRSGVDLVSRFVSKVQAPTAARPAERHYGPLARLQPDTVAPETAIDAGAGRAGRPAAFTLSSPDAGVRFECRVDGGRWSTCKQRFAASGTPARARRLEARAVDAAGNADASPAVTSLAGVARR